jgi:hypothetical protein
MLSAKVWALSLGCFLAVLYVLSVLWIIVFPPHGYEFLQLVLPMFKWLNPLDLVLGLIESFLWGVVIALLFVPIHNFFHRRFGTN